jgi:T-complex protein 1 subunit delta
MKIQTSQGEVIITNDGATILKHIAVLHPAAKMVSHFGPSDSTQSNKST